MLHFDCDYMEGAHPLILRRLLETNLEQTPGYGNDPHTARARELVLQACGLEDGEVRLLVGGTQTNSTIIDIFLRRHEGVLAAETGHICVHEAGAVEAWGHKVLTLPSRDGKVSAEDVRAYIQAFYKDETFEHMVAPGMLYISFPTETGTIYTRDELEALSEVCRGAGIPLFIDGARLGYGLAASNDLTIKDIAQLCDVFYIGGTKVGALFGEAVVFSKPRPHLLSLVKQHGALLAKGRILGIQFETLFEDGLYFRISEEAVRLAMKLRRGFLEAGCRLFADSPTNQQFFVFDNSLVDRLSKEASFECWGPRGETQTPVRFVTSWATREEDVDRLVELVRACQVR